MKGKNVLVIAVAAFFLFSGAAYAGGACCSKDSAVTKQVENLANGVKITMTSNDPKVVAKLQSKEEGAGEGCQGCPMHAQGVTKTTEKLPNGVVITATATDPKLVSALQQHAAEMTAGHKKGHGKGACCAKGEAKGSGCSKGAAHYARPTT
ncbi:MAG: hypothetical protein N2447_05800 [Thermoanaerobaculum sp.]|nr:hypothetical protein [Thermoanaerobaculum sp.]